MARRIACDLVKRYGLEWAEVQIAYAIGQKEPMSVNVKTSRPDCDADYAREIVATYPLTPAGIIDALGLLDVSYEKLAEGCHYRNT